jgi:ATP/maltotriose-dependent transcriptional regulator MalT
VRNLSGAQRPIGAYLDELLDGLPRDMVQFMLRTAILDRLCAPLGEAVTGASSAQELLGQSRNVNCCWRRSICKVGGIATIPSSPNI